MNPLYSTEQQPDNISILVLKYGDPKIQKKSIIVDLFDY